jgi:putative FmdB family regulatory protein
MPLYEYQCDACAHRFEVIQKFSDAPLATCPKCGGAVRKLLSSPAIQFKGSGWYITDYARAGKSESKDAAPAAKTESESPAAADGSAPAAKADSKAADSKAADSKATDSKATDSKAADSKAARKTSASSAPD